MRERARAGTSTNGTPRERGKHKIRSENMVTELGKIENSELQQTRQIVNPTHDASDYT